jgi:hypothetical protein
MKAATETLDRTVVERPTYKQNLCLDKGYDFSEIEREDIKKDTLLRFLIGRRRIDKEQDIRPQ